MARPVYKYEIKLKGSEKHDLRQAKKKGYKNARLVIRFLIILLAHEGKTIADTAQTLDCCEQTVLNQRKRFLARRAEGVAALEDLPRPGRPVLYGPPARAQVTAIVCETLWERDLPLSRLSTADLLRVVVKEESLAHLSQSSLSRFLRQDALKPWQYRDWLFPRDPDFVSKACVILDLYAGWWEGQRLTSNEYVLSADEKSIQVLTRCHPGLPTLPGYVQRVEFEYERQGTLAYHVAWDVFQGKLVGRVAPTTSIATFNQLIDLVMTQAPYQTAARAFWIVDGGSAHHRSTFPTRLSGMYSNAVAVMLPVHASWLNQVELFFSIVQRKVLTPLDVANETALTNRLLAFQDYYLEIAKPFTWKFTADDLRKRMEALQAFSFQLGFTPKICETVY